MGFLGLYIHVPFCRVRCRYCDFCSVVLGRGPDPAAVVDRLILELESRTAAAAAPASTIFIGGGTPTALAVPDLARLLEAAARAAKHPIGEFTVEANPETLDAERAAILAEHGVDRISLGAQSFHQAELELLGRVHDVGQIAAAVEVARRSGIARINLDLIFGIPGQTKPAWQESLERAIELGTGHVSCYGLTYEPGTAMTEQLARGEIARCDDELEADLDRTAIDRLTQAGFEHYEISNFARPGERCRQNLGYWRHEPYIGVGPSAAGHIDRKRYRNVTDVGDYVRRIDEQGHAVLECEQVTGPVLAAEMTMLGLRLIEGLDVRRFHRRTGIDPMMAFASGLERFARKGLVQVDARRIALTRDGLLVADTIIADLLAELDG